MIKKGIGDILVDTGVINSQQLRECQKESEKIGKKLQDCLLEKNFITPVQLAQAYASYASLDFVKEVSDAMADPSLLGKVPLKFLRDNVVMPVMRDGKITLLTANPMMFQPLD